MAGKALVRRGAVVVANPWTPRILRAWASSLAGFIACGRLLIAAKKDLGHGAFLAMVERQLPFGPRMAQKLMRVASDPRIAKANPGSLLPPSPTTLHELSRLDDLTFRRALANGSIHPEMTRRDAGGLVHKAHRVKRLSRAAEQNVGKGVSLWLCDPPWPVEFDVPYRTMSLARIRSLRLGPDGRASKNHAHPSIAEASAARSAIAMWTIDPFLFDAESIMGSWGYELLLPRIIWHKSPHVRAGGSSLGMHEYLLVGVKGGARPSWLPTSVITISRRGGQRNSEKPAEFHGILTKMFPLLIERCELFARRATPGWRGWGDQYPGA
jgi:N6-adenosine-specific RNA methylase IME4